MARLIIPDDFSSQQTLLANIAAQQSTLGTNSPLTSFLTQHNIVLDDAVAAGNAAQTHETNRTLLSRQSENYRQLRDNLFKTPWSHLTTGAQFLKSFYNGNSKELGNWSIPVTENGKINYPPAFSDRVALFNAFAQKHLGYAAGESPLQPILTQQSIDLLNDAGFTEQAAVNNGSFINAARQSENETELRNRLWQPMVAHIRVIGNFLMKLYSNNPKALGAWGFVVDDSSRKPKLRTTKLKLGEKITGKSVVIGSVITNVGDGDLHLYKGNNTSGTPAIIPKGEQLGITKGYGTVTVVNPSMLAEGRFTWLTNG